MKKVNIFIPIAIGAVALGTTGALIGVSAKSCSTQRVKASQKESSIIANNMATNLYFTLDRELKDDETLEVDYGEDTGMFSFQPLQVKGKLVILPIYWLQEDSDLSHKVHEWEGTIKFNLTKNNGKKIVWEQAIDNCKVTFLPYCTLAEGQDKEQTTQSIHGNVMTLEYKFNLPNGMPKGYECHLEAQTKTYGTGFTIDESDIYISQPDENNDITVLIPATKSRATTLAEGDSFEFDIQFFCMYGKEDHKADIPIWISAPFKGLFGSFKAKPNPIPTSMLKFADFEQIPGGVSLVGIDQEAFNGNYNTFEIPANYTDEKGVTHPVYQVGDGENPLPFPESVKTLTIGGTEDEPSNLWIIGKNAFNGCKNFKYIDASNILNTVDGLELMELGENSFAGWDDTGGTMIWGTDFSQYKRHTLMVKLYGAGLTYNNWYNITEVDSESKLREACKAGSNIKLTDDITISVSSDYTGQIDIEESLVMDLNGHTITSNKPIFNYDTKDFAIFGIWNGAEVVLTDSSEYHNGSVKAYDQTENFKKYYQNPITKKEDVNDWWDWPSEKNKAWPRECRTFYIRTDTPTRARTSLEILAGNFEGDCTTIMNWNGVCWIEEAYKSSNHDFAPTFKIHTPNYNPWATSDQERFGTTLGDAQLINCDNVNTQTHVAYFEIYGGKFYGMYNIAKEDYEFYDPSYATDDKDEHGNPNNWVYPGYGVEMIKPDETDKSTWFNLVYKP